jgi:hypothetical protein
VPELIGSLLCHRAIIDQATNLATYVDVVDGLDVQALPVMLPPLCVATTWLRHDANAVTMRVRVRDAAGVIVGESAPATLAFQPQHRRGRINCTVPPVPVTAPGRVSWEVLREDNGAWERVATIPLDVHVVSVPAPAMR